MMPNPTARNGAVPLAFQIESPAAPCLISDVKRMWPYMCNFILLGIFWALTGCERSQSMPVKRYDKPLTYSQATNKADINFPLPPSAHDIYYGTYGAWQAYGLVVRFDAPVRDCIKHIDTVLAWDDRNYNRTSSYSRITVTNVEPVDAGFPTPVRWFTPEKITRGIYAGAFGPHTPRIWVDLDKGTFYFLEMD